MTPSASASSIVLLAPAAAPAGVSAGAETTPAPTLDGGFQLLVDAAAQQQMAAQLAGSAAKPQIATGGDNGGVPAEAGNVLPLPGVILPIDGDQPVVGEKDMKKMADSADKDDSALPATPQATTTIPLPWVPVNIQPQQPVAKNPGSHASADSDATVETDFDVTARAAANANAVAVSTSAVAPQPVVAGDDAAAATAAAAASSGIQLGVAGMTAPVATNRQPGAARAAQPSFDALVNPSTDGAQTTPAGASKGGDLVGFADALKSATGTTTSATDPAQQPATAQVGAVDTGRAHAPTRSYLDVNNATTGATVSVPVGSNGWSDAVVDKVMWFSANQINSAEIKLNPPDLGPLHIRISTQQDQTTSVVFSSPHAAVRDALDQALPRLRDMFGGQGLQLSDASVGGQAQRQQQGGEQAPGQGQRSSWFGAEESGDTPVAVTRVVGPRLSTSAVDAYA